MTVLLYFFIITGPPALALTDDQKRVIDSGVLYFDTETGAAAPSCVGGGTTLVGGTRAEQIWNYFIGKGLSPIQAAGAMGNIQKESGFDPGITEIGGGGGYGIIQWTGPRRTALEQAAAEKGVAADDLAFQLDFLFEEMQGMLEEFKTKTDLRDATLFFHDTIERSADGAEGLNKRVEFATDILAAFGSSSGGNNPTGTVACGTTGQVVGGFSLPVDRHWYDEHPEWFTKPHHSPPPASDLPIPEGTPIYSISAGTVIAAPTGGDCGMGVEIDAGNGVRFIYCHGSDGGAIDGARQGDQINAGQLIMHSSYTGHVLPAGPGGSHLHVGLRINGRDHCPQNLFVGIANGTVPALESLPTSGCTN